MKLQIKMALVNKKSGEVLSKLWCSCDELVYIRFFYSVFYFAHVNAQNKCLTAKLNFSSRAIGIINFENHF